LPTSAEESATITITFRGPDSAGGDNTALVEKIRVITS
jgi:hypothetical protein